ncbi:hypothetical protein [Synechococcus sp. GFB01]|uniref:hypothetical protein n=1 Tax=Synechococcus sp. GFB01 TaxID=1662190 RepID=UPI000AF49D06|nr:hypothetical protein [Synechococcus sp. GFB01]
MTLMSSGSGSIVQLGLNRFAAWFADAVHHAIGSLHDQDALAPPLIGVQPYTDRPVRKR